MRIVHATYSDGRGGAARASYRVHRALLDHGVESWMVVEDKVTDDERVLAPPTRLQEFEGTLARRLNGLVRRLQRTSNPTVHSPAFVSGSASRRLRRLEPTVVNLHWVAAGLLTVREIGRLPFPIVWRLPDMWAFCGAEHYDAGNERRWQEGYTAGNRSADHSGLDVDRWTWRRKWRVWDRAFHLVTPSSWMAEKVASSRLLGSWPVTVIPNPLDLDVFRPVDRRQARRSLGLPLDKRLVLFGADGGSKNPNKGFDLLQEALVSVAGETPEVAAVVFGQGRPPGGSRSPYPVHWLGRIDDDERLAAAYSAADVLVVPSRREAFGQTGSEAHACGTPVVAFRETGLEDIVDHTATGHLAQHQDVEDLARGIRWVLEHPHPEEVNARARQKAVTSWSPDRIAELYLDVYERARQQQTLDPGHRCRWQAHRGP